MHESKGRNSIKKRFYILVSTSCTLPKERHKHVLHECVGPLVTVIVLDSMHYKINDLENRELLDTFHINRLKLAFVSTPAGPISTQ